MMCLEYRNSALGTFHDLHRNSPKQTRVPVRSVALTGDVIGFTVELRFQWSETGHLKLQIMHGR